MPTSKNVKLLCYATIIMMLIVVIVVSSTYNWNVRKPSFIIVGAGPTGLTMALELCDRGYRNITIYGDVDNSQMRNAEFDGVDVPVGAPSVVQVGRSQYSESVQLATRFKMKPTDVWRMSNMSYSKPDDVITINKYRNQLPLRTIRNSFNLSIEKWLEVQGLTSDVLNVDGLLIYDHMGYGPLVDVPLHKSVTGIMLALSGEQFGYSIDMNKLMHNIKHYLENKGVTFIDKKVNIVDEKKIVCDDSTINTADIIVIACDPRSLQHPLKSDIDKYIEHTNYFTAVFKVTGGPALPSKIFVFNDVIRAKKQNMATGYVVLHEPGKPYRMITAYGYFSDNISDDAISNAVLDQLKATLPDNTIVVPSNTKTVDSVVTQLGGTNIFRWKYNLRFNKVSIENNIPKMVNTAQGVKNIWYTGGLFSHWDLSSIISFNKMLVKFLLKSTMKKQNPTVKIY